MPLCTRERRRCDVLSATWFLSRNFGGLCCNRRRRPVSGTERSRSGVSSLGRLLSTRRPSLIRRQTSPALPANMSTLRTREIIRTWKPMVTVDPNCFASLSEWKLGRSDRPKLAAIDDVLKSYDLLFNENLSIVFVAGFTANEWLVSAVALSFGSRIMQMFLIPQISLISSRLWITNFIFSRRIWLWSSRCVLNAISSRLLKFKTFSIVTLTICVNLFV